MYEYKNFSVVVIYRHFEGYNGIVDDNMTILICHLVFLNFSISIMAIHYLWRECAFPDGQKQGYESLI